VTCWDAERTSSLEAVTCSEAVATSVANRLSSGDGPLDLVEHLVEVLADLLHLLVVAFGVRAGSEVAVGGSTHDRTVLGGFFLQVTVDLLDALAFAFGLLAGGFGFLNLLAQRDAHRVETIVEPADVVDPLGLEVHVEIPLHLTGLVGESVDRDGGVPTEDRTDHADQEDADDGRVDPHVLIVFTNPSACPAGSWLTTTQSVPNTRAELVT